MSNIHQLYPDGPPYDGYRCPHCGSTWFELDVLLDKHRKVTGWAEYGHCRDCEQATNIEGWTHDGT